MSFPRAKLQRFNDVTSCAPAPGSYDPKYEDRVHGTVIERSERFNEPKNKPPDSQAISISGRSPSLNNLAVFRTPVIPKKVKRSNATQQQKEHVVDTEASVSQSEVDALKRALIDREQQVQNLQLQLERVVKQHPEQVDNQQDFSQLAEKNSSLETGEIPQQYGDTITNQISPLLMSDMVKVEVTNALSAEDILYQSALFTDQFNDSLPSLGNIIADGNSSMIAHLEAQLSEKKTVVAGLEQLHVDLAFELLEAETKARAMAAVNQELEAEVKALRERVLVEEERISDGELKSSASEAKSRKVGALNEELEAEDVDDHYTRQHISEEDLKIITAELTLAQCELAILDIARALTDFESKHQQELINLVPESLELTQTISAASKNILTSQYDDTYLYKVLVFVENVHKRRKYIVNTLRKTILERDELRVSDLEQKITIVDLHDEIQKKAVELKEFKKLYNKDIDIYKCRLEGVQLDFKKYKVGNKNLHSSLDAVSERLMNSHQELEHMTTMYNEQLSDNKCLHEKITEQHTALEVQKEAMALLEASHLRDIETQKRAIALLEASNLRDIEKIHTELSSKIENLQEKIINQKKDHQSEMCIYLGELQLMQSKLNNMSEKHTEFEKRNESLAKQNVFWQTKCVQIERKLATYVEENKPLHSWPCVREHSLMLRNRVLPEYKKYVERKRIIDYMEILKEVDIMENLTVQAIVQQSAVMIGAIMKRFCWEKEVIPIETITGWYQEVDLLFTLTTKSTESYVKERIEDKYRKELFGIYVHLIREDKGRQLIKQFHSEVVRHEEIEQQLEAKDAEIRQLNKCHHEQETAHIKVVNELRNDVRLMSKTVDDLGNWKNRCLKVEALVGPFRQQLKAFESERLALESKKDAADSEVKCLAQKYAEVLGHQNHKQKIRHVVQLKQLNLELKQNVSDLESKLRHKNKSMEKLKEELAAFHVKEKKVKERVGRPLPLGENSPSQRHIEED